MRVERGERARWATRLEILAPARDEPLELPQVELAVVDVQPVAGPGVSMRRRRARVQPVHVHLQRLLRGGRRILAPNRIDEAVTRDDFPGLQKERREERALLRRTKRNPASVIEDRDRPEHVERESTPRQTTPGQS